LLAQALNVSGKADLLAIRSPLTSDESRLPLMRLAS
jgi:hypothetical protein